MLRALADLVLPLRCAACGRPAPQGLCGPCNAAAEALVLPDLARVELAEGVEAVGLWAYEGVARDAVVGMKTRGRFAAAGPIGERLRARLPLAGVPLTWVPASRRRRRLRGFDLPELLAGPAAQPLLERVREGPDQTRLDARARRRAPVGAFLAAGRVPAAVVLLDDVRTTGATARSAAIALRRAGARRVLVVTLAVGGDEARATAGADAGATARR